MKKKYPIRQKRKMPPDEKTNRLTFTPPARQRVAFFRRCGKRRH
ncbi:hypothetical protein SDC9_46942 [bioreactor metagenome]|uniref:Uncharacterized protein n=1 Tax=bioreactor metagenome TaxID=1076179 RepID=A0A644WAE3_9ZZZZ|nr:hypothetical protein [Desulfitobacterium hafniense]MEA5025786.1 hypothetical protein [Desulfitobacterium hafniense]